MNCLLAPHAGFEPELPLLRWVLYQIKLHEPNKDKPIKQKKQKQPIHPNPKRTPPKFIGGIRLGFQNSTHGYVSKTLCHF